MGIAAILLAEVQLQQRRRSGRLVGKAMSHSPKRRVPTLGGRCFETGLVVAVNEHRPADDASAGVFLAPHGLLAQGDDKIAVLDRHVFPLLCAEHLAFEPEAPLLRVDGFDVELIFKNQLVAGRRE